MRSLKLSWVFALFASIAASTAFAAPPNQPPIDDRQLPGATHQLPIPRAGATGSTAATPTPGGQMRIGLPIRTNSQYTGSVPDGTRVPLFRLPRFPMKTAMNTATPRRHTGLHPMAASGATIDFSGTATQNSCEFQGAIGDQFNIGCTFQWHAINLSPTGDTYQQYYIAPSVGNETNTSATAAGGSFSGASGGQQNTTLTVNGTYIFGVYDVTAAAWAAVVYVNAGQLFTLKVYQDSFHTQEQYQFSATSGTNAYIYLQNVSQSDYLAVGVSQTSVKPNCVFIAPAPLPSPYTYTANQLCNMTASTGEQAPGGNLAVTWPMSTSYTAGTYSVEVYDITAGQRLGQVQVGITNASGIALAAYPDGSGADINPSPAPLSAATPSTVLAWDGANWSGSTGQDESITGIKTTVNGLTNGSNYLWSIIDPEGQVVGTAAGTIAGNAGTNTFTFDSLTGGAAKGGALNQVLPPGSYPAKSWVVQLYDTTNKVVRASQSFQMLGYSTYTQFNNSGTLTDTLSVPTGAGGATTTVRITNNSAVQWNGYGDTLAKIQYSTSSNSFDLVGGSGNGIQVQLNGGSSETVADSVGNNWSATSACQAGSTGFCVITLVPSVTGTTLATGAYIDVTNVKFTQSTGNSCAPCQSSTSELPTHGMAWSTVLNSPAVSYNPTYFNKPSGSESGNAWFRFFGSTNSNHRNISVTTVTPAPNATPSFFVGTHYYTNTQAQADYANNSPYTVSATFGNLAASNEDIMGFIIDNTGSDNFTEVAVALPGVFALQGFGTVDSASTGWSFTNCDAGFSSNWICFSGNVPSGGSAPIYLDNSLTASSFAYTELQVEGFATHGSTSQWTALTAKAGTVTTVDGKYTVDNLAVGAFSLIGNDMTAAFNPSTVGTGGTATLGWQFTNTSTSVDAFPDSIDAIVLEAPNTTVTLSNTPSMTTAGWSYEGKYQSGTSHNQYWFGTCAGFFTKLAVAGAGSYGGPPSTTGAPQTTPFATPYPSATCAPDTSAVGPGANVIATNMQFTSIGAAGTQTWNMYAHGANGGGWSSAVPMTLTVSAESASIWFNQVNGSAVATNTIPTISSGPNTYQYAIKNTSSATNVGTIVVTIPGLDVNNQNAFDGSQAWAVTNITTGGVTLSQPGGQADTTSTTCTVDTTPANTFNPTNGGANGQITIHNCGTQFKPGDTLYVNFSAQNPSSQNDTYAFPATVDGTNAGTQWLGSDEITESFSIALNIVIDPANPGPGGSAPVESCQGTCTFSGSTVDFGNIPNSTAFTYSDVVRTSVVYTGATSAGHSLQMYVQASQNPATTGLGGSPSNELQSLVDSATSTSGAGITFNTTSYTVIPTATTLLMATVPETQRASGYDVIDSYKVSIGTEATSSTIVTLTYTLVAI